MESLPKDFRAITSISWFSRTAIEEDSKNEFERQSSYSWGSRFFWGFEVEALSSRFWRYFIAVNDYYITYYGRDGSVDAKRSRHVSAIAKGILALPIVPLVEAYVVVDIWIYLYNC